MISLVAELEKRLTENTAVLSGVVNFSPNIIKRDFKFDSLPFKTFCPDIVKVNIQSI